MDKLSPTYLPAMYSLNDFYSMLYQSLRDALPGAFLSTSGAYVWRGYRIDSYKNLATCQYYCLIYTAYPDSLLFEESYHYRSKYCTPFKRTMVLGKDNFFGLSIENQIKSIINFIRSASYEALGWQISDERQKTVPKSLLLGKNNPPQWPESKYTITHVPELMLQAYPLQDKLFSLLQLAIEKASEMLFHQKVEIFPNASSFNWDFRGLRMKFKDSVGKTQEGASEYVWQIYFKDPSLIQCDKYDDEDFPFIPPFKINKSFLAAPENEQIDSLTQFACESLKIEKPPFSDPFFRKPTQGTL